MPGSVRADVQNAPTGPRNGSRRGLAFAALALCGLFLGCGSGGSSESSRTEVNSLEDLERPPAGTVTLRSALAAVSAGGTITFDPALDGGTIRLTLVGEPHSTLPGEVYPQNKFGGYQDRDYGRSALYAKKSLAIDASNLPAGITLAWAGGDASHARVLAVYGDLALNNVTLTSGYAQAEALDSTAQPWTLARGGGLAVWGTATLDHCTIGGNTASGDLEGSRDRGTYGGGIYANAVALADCVVSGNLATGYGAAGGGIYSVGGGDGASGIDARLTRCAVTGNRVTAQHAYGGGLFTLGGGPSHSATMTLTNCTLARNLAQEKPSIPSGQQHYCRGGGVYLGGGSLAIQSCTLAENQVTGVAEPFSGKPNLGGGGVGATIGNAHVVESMKIWHSIIVGNELNGAAEDVFTGSLLHFYSYGCNRIGKLDFSQILVPVPPPDSGWLDLSRKHWPKTGDADGLTLGAVLDAGAVHRHPSLLSAGTDAGEKAVLWYPPAGSALDQVPAQAYRVNSILGGYLGYGEPTDDFLNLVLARLRTEAYLGGGFWPECPDMTGVTWYGPSETWVTSPDNASWIKFWRDLDARIGTALGTAVLGDDFWADFPSGAFDHVTVIITRERQDVTPVLVDQLGAPRPEETPGDIGAIELAD